MEVADLESPVDVRRESIGLQLVQLGGFVRLLTAMGSQFSHSFQKREPSGGRVIGMLLSNVTSLSSAGGVRLGWKWLVTTGMLYHTGVSTAPVFQAFRTSVDNTREPQGMGSVWN